MAGVVGMDDRWLLNVVSTDNGCVCGTAELMPWPPHSYELPCMILDALAGGVGKVLARSSPGRPDMWEDMGVCIEWWWWRLGGCGAEGVRWAPVAGPSRRRCCDSCTTMLVRD